MLASVAAVDAYRFQPIADDLARSERLARYLLAQRAIGQTDHQTALRQHEQGAAMQVV
jgi:hypothetical protein